MARLKLQHGKKPKGIRSRGGAIPRDRGGSVYLPDKLQLVRMIAMRGATDDEIADTFNVSRDMFQNWKKAYPSMFAAIENGRSHADVEVVASLFKQTQGYDYKEETVAGKDGDVVEVRRYARPDFSATKYWLDNRQPLFWKSASTTRISGAKDEPPVGMKVETRNELIDAIVGLIAPKADGATKPPESASERVKR